MFWASAVPGPRRGRPLRTGLPEGTHVQPFQGPLSIPTDLKASHAILDWEIVCLDGQGRSLFYDLMFHRGEPYFYAFDLLWKDGVDIRELPLVERKAKLRELVPRVPGGTAQGAEQWTWALAGGGRLRTGGWDRRDQVPIPNVDARRLAVPAGRIHRLKSLHLNQGVK